LAIVVDNADGIGPSARAALDAAAGPRTLLVLGGHAFDDPGDPGDTAAAVDGPLGGLDRAAVGRLAAAAAYGPITPDEIERLLAYSGGNPLVLEILLPGGPGSPEAAFRDPKTDTATRLSDFAA